MEVHSGKKKIILVVLIMFQMAVSSQNTYLHFQLFNMF